MRHTNPGHKHCRAEIAQYRLEIIFKTLKNSSSLLKPQCLLFSAVESDSLYLFPSILNSMKVSFDRKRRNTLSWVFSFSSPEPLGFTHHYEWLWLQPKIRIFSLANETQCALGIKLQSTAHFRRVINCNVVVFKNQRVYKRTCFSFEHFERR